MRGKSPRHRRSLASWRCKLTRNPFSGMIESVVDVKLAFGRGMAPWPTFVPPPPFCVTSVMGSIERTREIRRRRSRRVKLKKLREKFAKATNEADKAALLAKAQRVSPLITTLEIES